MSRTAMVPLLGISLGFDAINSEQNNGTLTRLTAQPLYRDNLLLAKFVSALVTVSTLFIALALLMTGGGLISTSTVDCFALAYYLFMRREIQS